jgi:ABC-type Zn uptake system ZnuABC Zn-binding protein ZnuA
MSKLPFPDFYNPQGEDADSDEDLWMSPEQVKAAVENTRALLEKQGIPIKPKPPGPQPD